MLTGSLGTCRIEFMKDKMTYTTIGFGFLALNLYARTHEMVEFSLVTGTIGLVFFIKALTIRQGK